MLLFRVVTISGSKGIFRAQSNTYREAILREWLKTFGRWLFLQNIFILYVRLVSKYVSAFCIFPTNQSLTLHKPLLL